jgi:hypothetical protein
MRICAAGKPIASLAFHVSAGVLAIGCGHKLYMWEYAAQGKLPVIGARQGCWYLGQALSSKCHGAPDGFPRSGCLAQCQHEQPAMEEAALVASSKLHLFAMHACSALPLLQCSRRGARCGRCTSTRKACRSC